jgi:hypothetical protein
MSLTGPEFEKPAAVAQVIHEGKDVRLHFGSK